MALMGRAAAVANPLPTLPTPMASANIPRIQAPNAFDGTNPEDLRPFLLQCQLIFNSYPQQYAMGSSKVFFAISYLKKSALEWFEHGVMETDPNHAPAWRLSWDDFVLELHMYFGPANPTGDAKIELRHLTMLPES